MHSALEFDMMLAVFMIPPFSFFSSRNKWCEVKVKLSLYSVEQVNQSSWTIDSCKFEGSSVDHLIWSAQGKASYTQLFMAMYSWVLDISKDRNFTASLRTCSDVWPLCEHFFLYIKLKFQLKFVASCDPTHSPYYLLNQSLFAHCGHKNTTENHAKKHLLSLRWTTSTSLPLFTEQFMYKVILLARHGLPLVSWFLSILKSSSCPSCSWKWLLLWFLMWGSLVWSFPEPLTCPS